MAWVEHLRVAEGGNVPAILREGKAQTSHQTKKGVSCEIAKF